MEYDKEMKRYFRLIQQAMKKNVDIHSFKCVLLLSRDKLNIQFNNYLIKNGIRANSFMNMTYSGSA